MTNQQNNNSDHFFSLKQAAEHCHVTKQAIYVAIRKKRLKATKENRRWCISKVDLNDYRSDRYNRDHRTFNNEPVFDIEKGFFSVHQVCKIISEELQRPYSLQHIYYLMRSGQLKSFKKGNAWVIPKDAAIDLVEKEKNSGGDYVRQLRLC